jgi:putative SOS response-associated peptidase YedK
VCGRFPLPATPASVERAFDLEETPDLAPRFNIAPGQDVATIHQTGEGRRTLVLRRWGLVPAWASDPKIGSRLINARAETAATKPSFRTALRRRRCLVPADGFFEWAAASSGPRQPYWIAQQDHGCFAIAGLYERWRSEEADAWLETCTLLTTEASPALRGIHHRMPVILAPGDYALWLDPMLQEPERLAEALRPRTERRFELRAVSRRVNRPGHDAADCIAPLSPQGPA